MLWILLYIISVAYANSELKRKYTLVDGGGLSRWNRCHFHFFVGIVRRRHPMIYAFQCMTATKNVQIDEMHWCYIHTDDP